MECEVCGSEIPSGSEFCPICGAWNIPESALPILRDEDYSALESEALKSSIQRDLEEIAKAYKLELEGANPQELEEVEVVRPEILARWREWEVPEEIIERCLRQKEWIRKLRKVEEHVTVPDYAYKMPRLPEIEANPWGFAKVIDTEGYIYPRHPYARDKIARIDRWLYRYEFYRPRVVVLTRTYDLTEEIANIMHAEVTIARRWDTRIKAYATDYVAFAHTARAVRICYLTEPHLVVPNKKRRAREILILYRESPQIPRA